MQYRGIGGSVARVVLGLAFALILSACHSGSSESSSQALRNDNPLILSGSVGDGPIAGASVTVLDAGGNSVVAGVSDDAAGYEITVPAGTIFPLTITATGGTDLVTGAVQSFDMKGVLLDPSTSHVNVSPFSTLAVAIAGCGGAKVTTKGLTNA
ncbi:MAG TPA: hypothetical protein VFG38_07340, partial [Pseudomonadales bacterium]|nr:hypothetical protein [Pseudomonadales bacterium]